MKNRLNAESGLAKTFLASLASLALLPAATLAQVPVDENGEIIGDFEPQYSEQTTGNDDIPLLSTVDLEELVGPIALYPDDLLAIVLPAAAYPLQIVAAARFLEALENDPSLKPDPEWDDSVVALINYPEVIELLNDDIDWTWRLGEAVVSQQADVVGAIETFRDRAYTAGNLKSDSYQNVSHDDGVIEITPVAEDVIYVPYYEPELVVAYQPRPVYYYYPRPYPVYYYPYSSAYAFDRGYFWGVTTAFTIGWYSDSLNVFHHSYYGHPYYGRTYRDRWWYRRPALDIHYTNYGSRSRNVTVNHYYGGDRWQPRDNRRDYVSQRRVTRNRYNPGSRTDRDSSDVQRVNRQRTARIDTTRRVQTREPRVQAREPISFRERPQTMATNRRASADSRRYATGVAPRSTETAPRTRTVTARRTEPTPKLSRAEPTQQVRRAAPTRQVRRAEPTQQVRRATQTPRARRAEPTQQVRRATPTPQVRRAEPTQQVRRATPTPQVRRAEPTQQVRRATPTPQVRRAEPQRQQRTEKSAARPAKTESSKRQSSKRQSSVRHSERRK